MTCEPSLIGLLIFGACVAVVAFVFGVVCGAWSKLPANTALDDHYRRLERVRDELDGGARS